MALKIYINANVFFTSVSESYGGENLNIVCVLNLRKVVQRHGQTRA